VCVQSVQITLTSTTECRRTEVHQIKTVLQGLFPSVEISDSESVSWPGYISPLFLHPNVGLAAAIIDPAPYQARGVER